MCLCKACLIMHLGSGALTGSGEYVCVCGPQITAMVN